MYVKSILIKQINTKQVGDWCVCVILGVGHTKQTCSSNVGYRATHSFSILFPPQALLGRMKLDQHWRMPLFVFLSTCTSLVCLWHLAHCSLSSFHNLAFCAVKSLADLDLSGLALPVVQRGDVPAERSSKQCCHLDSRCHSKWHWQIRTQTFLSSDHLSKTSKVSPLYCQFLVTLAGNKICLGVSTFLKFVYSICCCHKLLYGCGSLMKMW